MVEYDLCICFMVLEVTPIDDTDDVPFKPNMMSTFPLEKSRSAIPVYLLLLVEYSKIINFRFDGFDRKK